MCIRDRSDQDSQVLALHSTHQRTWKFRPLLRTLTIRHPGIFNLSVCSRPSFGGSSLARLRVPSCPPRIASTDQKFSRQLVFSTAPLPCGNFKPKRVQKTFYKLNLPRSKVPTIFFCTGAQVTLIELNRDTREIRASKVSTIERETRTFFLHIDAVCAGYAQVTLS